MISDGLALSNLFEGTVDANSAGRFVGGYGDSFCLLWLLDVISAVLFQKRAISGFRIKMPNRRQCFVPGLL